MPRALYFCEAESQLFGVHHPPTTRQQRAEGVLLCYPGPQEYMRCHWAVCKLAGLLSQRGYPTFRFDYFATGDSAGDSDAGTLARWQQDIATAAEELVGLSQVRQVSIVGLRLGAALAAGAVAAGRSVRSLALWEPVVSGAGYLAELAASDELERAWSLCPGPRNPAQLLGHLLSEGERRAIAGLDLAEVKPVHAARVALFYAEASPAGERLRQAWTAQGLPCASHLVPEDGPRRQRGTFLANRALAGIADWLDGGA